MVEKVILYTSYQSFHSQKVLIYLYEKGVEFETCVLDAENGENYTSWYLNINPRGELPTLEVEDKFISGSDEIIDYVKQKVLGRQSLKSTSSPGQELKLNSIQAKLLDVPVEQLIFGTAYFPQCRTSDVPPFNSESFRAKMIRYNETRCQTLRLISKENSGTPAEAILLAKAIEYTTKTRKYADQEEHQKILKQILSVLEEMENHLSKKFFNEDEQKYPFYMEFQLKGKALTDIDCLLAVILHQLEYLGYNTYITRWFALSRWWKIVQKRDSFQRSTKVPIFNIPVLKRKISEHRFKIITVLGLFAAFAFGYSYRSSRSYNQTMTRFIILEKLW